MEPKYIQRITEKLNFSLKQVNNILQLHAAGSTVPFISRYRKEATGNMDEVQISTVIEKILYFEELCKRKETVLKTIDASGKLTAVLKERIENSFDDIELEDIYLPYKPKRKTRAAAALAKGLEPLAKIIFEQGPGSPESEAEAFINNEVKDTNEALSGARDIIAEWVAENEQARNSIRRFFENEAVLSSKIASSKKEGEEAQKYRDYFEFSEPLKRCPSHRVLAIRRGEKEGFLIMDISINKQAAVASLEKLFVKSPGAKAIEVKKCVEDSFDRLLKPSIENEFRVISKNKADDSAITVFAENLRQLLMSPPLGSKRILALDPGFRTGCKLVCIDEQGNLLYNTTIYPHPPVNRKNEAITEVKSLCERYLIEAIGVGNGTAGRETEQMIREIDFGRKISIFQVNESGASIYSASEVAREELPDYDVTVRGAVSIGRRLLDPLSELVKIDAKSIGVGQYQHDVNQTRLKESLDKVVESCVNHVGVNLNTASWHLLMFVSGLSSTLAKNIVEYRQKNGSFRSRSELKKVSLMGPKAFEQSAGFLRIPAASNKLDNSAVHPESYHIVSEMARDLSCTVEDLMQKAELRQKLVIQKYVSPATGEYTIADIIKELEKPGRDPRQVIEEFQFNSNIQSVDDVKTGMVLAGVVTNITSFGAFVDVGVKQDGLVHISQMSDKYITDPNQVVKLNQKVMVTVTEVDVARKRLALSMKSTEKNTNNLERTNNNQGKEAPSRAAKTNGTGPKGSTNPFHTKLAEIKKNLEDK